jgi:hypothetical protein
MNELIAAALSILNRAFSKMLLGKTKGRRFPGGLNVIARHQV